MPSPQIALPLTDVAFPFENFELAELVEALGSPTFPFQMLQFLDRLIGADHCALFELKDYKLSELITAGPKAVTTPDNDITLYEVKRQLSQVPSCGARVDVSSQPEIKSDCSNRIQRRHQRIMICSRRAKSAFCIRVSRSCEREPMNESEISSLRQIADLLISICLKHADLFATKPNLTPALRSLSEIEECVLTSTKLSRREGEVCSRILYGLSSFGIALDLGIGKESVMTYRKRAYQRLGIGSQRELLMWYLAHWGARSTEIERNVVETEMRAAALN